MLEAIQLVEKPGDELQPLPVLWMLAGGMPLEPSGLAEPAVQQLARRLRARELHQPLQIPQERRDGQAGRLRDLRSLRGGVQEKLENGPQAPMGSVRQRQALRQIFHGAGIQA